MTCYYFSVSESISPQVCGWLTKVCELPKGCVWRGTNQITLSGLTPELIARWHDSNTDTFTSIVEDIVPGETNRGLLMELRNFWQALEKQTMFVIPVQALQAESLFNCDRLEIVKMQNESPTANELIRASIRKRKASLVSELKGLAIRYPDFGELKELIEGMEK